MRLWRRVRVGALLGWGLAIAVAAPASAQIYEGARDALGLQSDALARSPRLAGMGRLTVVGDDPHNRIDYWNFAGNAVGIGAADSTSTFELRPGTAAASAVQTDPSRPYPFESQYVAGREMRTGVEAWRRSSSTTYGIYGNLNSLRLDQPYSTDTEVRGHFSNPDFLTALNGPVPYLKSGRLKYALAVLWGRQSLDAEYRGMVSNAAGEYIDRNGATLTPPNFFVPDEARINTLGGSAALSYRFGSWLDAAAVGKLTSVELVSGNSGERYSSEVREKLRGSRPYPEGRATLLGHVGKNLEWGWDGGIWSSRSEQRWAFTTSAGIGQNPLTGQGKLADHEQRQSDMTARVRWSQGLLEVGGSFGTVFQQSVINPPSMDDPTSLNKFLYQVYNRPNADSLALPDSVSYGRVEQRVWQGAGGVSFRFPGRRGLVAAEYHRYQIERSQVPGGVGPRRTQWDLRAGLEYRCTPVLTGRGGYIYRSTDLDELTRSNEYKGNTGTLGFSIQPVGAMWSFDLAWGMEWWYADYGDPTLPHGSRQQASSQLRLAF